MHRSTVEKIFLVLFMPAVIAVYAIKAYPGVVLGVFGVDDPFGTYFYILGKSPNFWYQTIYTGLVCGICGWLLLRGKSPYGAKAGREKLSSYQKKKFSCILGVQLVGFYLIPFVLPMVQLGSWSDLAQKNDLALRAGQVRYELPQPLSYSPTNPSQALMVNQDGELLPSTAYQVESATNQAGWTMAQAVILATPPPADGQLSISTFHRVHKLAHVYLSPAFFSMGPLLYMFVAIPIFVWFFGKRYCSWVCACGNLAETVGTTPWGAKWVREGTPRGKTSRTLEWIQAVMLVFAVVVGVSAILNVYHVISPGAYHRLWYLQDFITDFTFGSVAGVGLYPFFGTRIWCRYGCPMAQWMKLFGRWSRSRYAVVPNDACIGVEACTAACPMGIPVDSYAHKDNKPIEVAFGNAETPCIGCGGCIDACPVQALSFQTLNGRTVIVAKDSPS